MESNHDPWTSAFKHGMHPGHVSLSEQWPFWGRSVTDTEPIRCTGAAFNRVQGLPPTRPVPPSICGLRRFWLRSEAGLDIRRRSRICLKTFMLLRQDFFRTASRRRSFGRGPIGCSGEIRSAGSAPRRTRQPIEASVGRKARTRRTGRK